MKKSLLTLLMCLTMVSVGFGAEMETIETGDFPNPKGISNFSRNKLIVADGLTGEIRLVNKDNSDLTTVLFSVTRGKPTALLRYRKRIFIGNETLGTVDVYGRRGKFLRSLVDPVGRASDMSMADRLLYVVDGEYKHIKVFNRHGRIIDIIDHPMLAQPCNIAISGDVIYVSDNGDSKRGPYAGVAMFSRYDYGYLGRLEGEEYGFIRPRGLSFNGSILQISETLSGKIVQVDTADMQRVEDLGEFGHLRGQLISPKDIHFDAVRKTLYVVNHRAGRIEALQVQ